MMAAQPTDAELLQCPEAIEPQFIHRGRRDTIAVQAGKENKRIGPDVQINYQTFLNNVKISDVQW